MNVSSSTSNKKILAGFYVSIMKTQFFMKGSMTSEVIEGHKIKILICKLESDFVIQIHLIQI